METLELEEITQAIDEYLSENYVYDYADVFEDEIVCHLGDKTYTISIKLEKGVE